MAYWQSSSDQATDFSGADIYVCRIVVPYAHQLISATLYTQNVVTTGTVSVTLKQTDKGDSRGGATVGEALDNTDLLGLTNTNTGIAFTLSSDDTGPASANRQYFLVLSSTNSADRVDEPVLVLKTT